MMLQTGPPLAIRAVQITKEKGGDRVPRFLAVTLERILVLAPVEADGEDMDARTSVSSGLLSAVRSQRAPLADARRAAPIRPNHHLRCLLACQGIVKSNHHLSELTRMTFKKSDPTIITLYFRNGMLEEGVEDRPRARVYHMDHKERLILALRTNMKRFR